MSSFAVADLHSCYTQWRQIQSFCKDSDRIYVLGDCVDRGDDSLKTLKSVLADPRTTLLLGNHEDMMAQTILDYYDGECEYGYPWFWNDGYSTFQQWVEDGYKKEWASTLRALPLWAKYTNQEGQEITMTHSGVVPKKNYEISSLTKKPLIWDRKCVHDKKWHRGENEIYVHGHTPTVMMPQLPRNYELEPGAFWYCEDHKCNIDNGGCWTGYICLLDLNTWEEHIFNG